MRDPDGRPPRRDRKSTRLNSSHVSISYAVFCVKKTNIVATIQLMLHAARFAVASATSIGAGEARYCAALLVDMNSTRDPTSRAEGLFLFASVQPPKCTPFPISTPCR